MQLETKLYTRKVLIITFLITNRLQGLPILFWFKIKNFNFINIIVDGEGDQ